MNDLLTKDSFSHYDVSAWLYDIKDNLYKESRELHDQWMLNHSNGNYEICKELSQELTAIHYKLEGLSIATERIDRAIIKKIER